jgi:hypothetical protein
MDTGLHPFTWNFLVLKTISFVHINYGLIKYLIEITYFMTTKIKFKLSTSSW